MNFLGFIKLTGFWRSYSVSVCKMFIWYRDDNYCKWNANYFIYKWVKKKKKKYVIKSNRGMIEAKWFVTSFVGVTMASAIYLN